MIVLVDTSVWFDHWRRGNPRLARLLTDDAVVVHPFVVGEIALGSIARRGEVLRNLSELYTTRVARHGEVMTLVDRTPLWGRGVGWVDAHLLASALLDRVRLWSLDQPLARAAADLRVALET
jgi:predicted nucleic acid-binding protein